ncbi:MAG: rRNA maturation RNase YbeY [Planctomycetia bacterium]|nr:rRNA maturation RNase YbeY [Planctomycetia bacterium]
MLLASSRQQPAAVSVDISDRQKILRVGQAWLERLVRQALVAEGIAQAEISILWLWGDIVVSTETAARVSREFGWTPRQELAYYVIHGLLHLSGYDDHSPADRRKMRGRERSLLKSIGLPVPPRTHLTRKR